MIHLTLASKVRRKKAKTARLFFQSKLYVMLAGPIDKKDYPSFHLTKNTCHIMVDFVKTCCSVNTRIAWQDFFISKLRFIISWLWYVSGKSHEWSIPRRTTAKLYAFKTFNQLRLFSKEKQSKKLKTISHWHKWMTRESKQHKRYGWRVLSL